MIIKTELARQVKFGGGYKGYAEDWPWHIGISQLTNNYVYIPAPTLYKRENWTTHYPLVKIPIIRKVPYVTKMVLKYRHRKVKELFPRNMI